MTSARQHAVRRFLGFVCLLLLVTSVLALLGWLPTKRLAGESGIQAMLSALAVTLSGSILSGIPVWRAEGSDQPASTSAVIGSLVIRFFFVLAATLYLVLNGLAERVPFVVWVGLSYLLLLPVDVRYALRGSGTRGEQQG